MKGGYEVQYEKIVKGAVPPVYTTPEEQGRQIKRCSILKNVEIEYSHVNRMGKKDYIS